MKHGTLDTHERELLLLSIRTEECFESRSSRRQQILEVSRNCCHWENLVEVTRSNSVTPLLYLSLSQCCPASVPKHILTDLHEGFQATAWRNLEVTAELLRILRLCESHGIRVVAYKGPLIAATLYGDLSFREFDDLDMFVELNDLHETERLLLANGYQAFINLDRKLEKLYFSSKCESIFLNKEKNICIEIHWKPVPKYFANIGESHHFLARAQPCFLGRKQVLTLQPEDLLVVLSVHGARHLWYSLKWICDLDRLIRTSPDLDWDRILEVATRCNILRMLYTGLHLTSSFLLTPIPEHIQTECIQYSGVKSLTAIFESQLFQLPRRYGEGFWTNHLRMRLLKRKRDKIHYMLGMVFRLSEDDVTWVKLPRWCYSTYYLLRPINLTRRYGQKIFKRGNPGKPQTDEG